MTFRSPIFRKLLSSAFLLIVVTLIVPYFYVTRYTAHREDAAGGTALGSGRPNSAGGSRPMFRRQLEDWARQASAARTRAHHHRRSQRRGPGRFPPRPGDDGESRKSSGNHRGASRSERSGQFDPAQRHHQPGPLLYGIRLTYHDQPGYILRLAVSLDDVDSSIAAVRWRILWASFYAALLALHLRLLLLKVVHATHRAAAGICGRIGRRPLFPAALPDTNDELGALGRSLSTTATQLRDLVDRLSVESAQREAILSSMVEGVLAVDGNLRITFANASFARVVGAPNPIPAGKPLVEVVRAPELREVLTRVLSSGESVRRRMQFHAAERVFEVQAAPLTSGTARGAIAILHDITDLERLERIRRDFVANVSHELRTPLTAIRGYAETLLEGALEDQENNRRFLEIIKAHAIRLNNISSDLLTLSELEAGKARPEPEVVGSGGGGIGHPNAGVGSAIARRLSGLRKN